MCYTYDSLSRVTARTVKKLSDNSVVSTETFSYDAAGNVTSAPDSSFQYDTNNRLISFNGNTVSYDLDGNMLSNGSLTCTYDSANRLITAGGHTYTYNAEDVRIRNLCTNEDTTYTYNTNAKLSMLLMKTTNGVVTKYVYGKGLIGEEVGSVFKTYHFDCRGSTIAITDASGNITDTFAYDTYGKLITRTGTSKVIFGYNGRDGVVTDDNGLIYMRARYYSPVMKRFINADIVAGKLSNAITLNRFAYANGNPVSNIDPFGLMSEAAYRRKAWLDEERMHGTQTKSPTAASQDKSASYYEKKLTQDEEKYHPEKVALTTLEAAHMANHIYGANVGDEISGWRLDEILVNENGFKMGVYIRVLNDGTNEYAIVNKGSTTKDDWYDNFKQPFGLSEDMKKSISLAIQFVEEHPDAYITFIGHSKGGGEALANAKATNQNAIVFNPAIPNYRIYGLGDEEYTAQATSYVVTGEILSSAYILIESIALYSNTNNILWLDDFVKVASRPVFYSKPFWQTEWLKNKDWDPVNDHKMQEVINILGG